MQCVVEIHAGEHCKNVGLEESHQEFEAGQRDGALHNTHEPVDDGGGDVADPRNPGEQAVVEITVRLQDTATNVAGLTFTNTADYTYNRLNDSTLISLLKPKRGATINEMIAATGWQAHSVRGFLAGALKKRHGLEAMSEKRDGEPRRYRLR